MVFFFFFLILSGRIKDASMSQELFLPSTKVFPPLLKMQTPINSAQAALRGSMSSEETITFVGDSPSCTSQALLRKSYGQQVRHEKIQGKVIAPTATITRPQVYPFKHKLRRSSPLFSKLLFTSTGELN